MLEDGNIPNIDEHILIDSDLTVAPVLNTKNKVPKYDEHAVGSWHHDAATIVAMSQQEGEAFTKHIMAALQLSPASRGRARSARTSRGGSAASARPEKRSVHPNLMFCLRTFFSCVRICGCVCDQLSNMGSCLTN